MLAFAAAVALVIALALDASHGGHVTAAAMGSAAAGMVLICLGVIFTASPYRFRRSAKSLRKPH